MKEIEKISNQLFELKEWLSEQPGHPSHLSNLPQWFWEGWGECIDDLKRLSKPKQRWWVKKNVKYVERKATIN